MRRRQTRETGRQLWESTSWILQRWEAQVEAEEVRGMLVVRAEVEVEVEVGWALLMLDAMEGLKGEVAEAEGRDSRAERLEEEVEVEEEAMREMMRHLLVGLVEAALVESRAQSLWALQEVGEQVQAAAEGVVQLELETVC